MAIGDTTIGVWGVVVVVGVGQPAGSLVLLMIYPRCAAPITELVTLLGPRHTLGVKSATPVSMC